MEALPKMADAATSSQLKEALAPILRKTEGHAPGLRKSLTHWAKNPAERPAKAMEGLIAGAKAM
jgi:ferritin-like metal-binding protein YciE